MTLRPYSCGNCGHWQRWFAEPPACPVCADVRNALPEDGWSWSTPADLADRAARWSEVTPGVTGFWCEPQVGLGTTGWVVETADGLVGWEGAGFYPPAAIAELRARGGLVALGASHVHGYGALWQLQDELAPPTLAIGVEDLSWTKAFVVTWPTDERHELAPGLVMHRSGGHFPGHNVLHDSGRGVLFVGDLLKVDLDGNVPVGLSCHKAFHAQIPLSHAEIRQARALVEELDFEAVATPFEFAAPVGRKQVLALFDRQLAGRERGGDVEISALDRVGVPVVAADHAGPPRCGSFGYGDTVEQARTGAYGELVEALLLHHHLRTLPVRRGSFAQLRAEGAIDPRTLVLPAGAEVDDDRPRDWLPAVSWRTGETVLLPAEFCASSAADLPAQDPAERLITVITNGAGAGETTERAVAHGLLELLQRDGNGTEFRALDRGNVLDVDGVRDPVTRAVLGRLHDAGVTVLPKLASTQFGLVDVHVVGIDADPHTEPLAVTACGEACHPDREVALRKAVLEYAAARSRKVFAHAPLERVRPLAPEEYWRRELARPVPPQEPRALEAMREWSRCSAATLRARLGPTVLARRSSTPFDALPTVPPGSLDDPSALLPALLDRLADLDVFVVLAPGDGAVAAKVVVPGLEVETMSYGRIGHRGVAKLLERDLGLVGLGSPPHPRAAPVVLTEEGRDLLGGDAWLDRAAVDRVVGPLYPLYREPTRHALGRS